MEKAKKYEAVGNKKIARKKRARVGKRQTASEHTVL